MNFLPRNPSAKKSSLTPRGKSETFENPEIARLRKSIADREFKILQDISNLSQKKASFSGRKQIEAVKNVSYEHSDNEMPNKIHLFESQDNSITDFDIKHNVDIAIKMLDEESPASAALEYFGQPDIRVTSRDLKRAKGNLWSKNWDKDPLPKNSLPDHFDN